jgi:hypothetical protein
MAGSRLTSDFWTSAFLRFSNGENRPATLRRRGSPEAGAVFVVLDRLDGVQALYGPAPQSLADEGGERLFQKVLEGDAPAIMARLERELKFDPDLWILDIESRDGDPRLPLAKEG